MVVYSIDNLYAPMTYTKIAGSVLLRFMSILVVLMKNGKCPWNKSALPTCLYRNNLPTCHRQFIRHESAIKGKAKKKDLLWHSSVMCLVLRGCAGGYADVWRQKIVFPSFGLISRVSSNFQHGLEVTPSVSLVCCHWQQNKVTSPFFGVLHGQWDLC